MPDVAAFRSCADKGHIGRGSSCTSVSTIYYGGCGRSNIVVPAVSATVAAAPDILSFAVEQAVVALAVVSVAALLKITANVASCCPCISGGTHNPSVFGRQSSGQCALRRGHPASKPYKLDVRLL